VGTLAVRAANWAKHGAARRRIADFGLPATAVDDGAKRQRNERSLSVQVLCQVVCQM
jgi:hypothetical protein